MRLKDKVALITGAGSGIGAAVAKRFAAEGALVAVADVVPQGAKEVMDGIMAKGGKAIFFQVDVRKADEVNGMIDQVTQEEWDLVVAVSLKGTFLCSQAAYRPMRKQKSGKIINTASVVVRGNMGQANYSASKAGIIGLTRTLALEYARSNIQVNCIAPGFIDTPMTAAIPDKIKEAALERIPLGRMGRPEDVADLHLFLASDEANYITGQVIFLDGGVSIGI
jgi:NAD(P)-dependent dehydrogenase (short-subunit alcohol dehydrogenase family)